MADFVAVIRRTVDGLSDNVPEMRSKVYEKARGAVRRQLEGMKPRPSDDMIDRQMAKLEAAISEVEGDYAEALPAFEEAESAPEAPVYDEYPVAQEPEAVHDAPAQSEPAAEWEPEPQPEAEPEQYSQPEAAEQSEPAAEPAEEPVEPYSEREAPVEPEPVAVVEEQPASQDAPVWDEEPAAGEPVSQEPEADLQEPQTEQMLEEPVVDGDYVPVEERHAYSDDQSDVTVSEPEPTIEAEIPQHDPAEEHVFADQVVPVQPEEPWHDPGAFEPVEVAPAAEHNVEVETPIAGSEWELPEWEQQHAPVAASGTEEPVWHESAAGDADGKVIDLAEYMPPETVSEGKVEPTSEPSHSWEWDDSDPFQQATPAAPREGSEPAISDWSWPVEKPAAADVPAGLPTAHWDDIDRLLDKNEPAEAAVAPSVPDPETMEAPARPVSYRVEPKKSGSLVKTAGIAAAILLALGGSGYAYWLNRDAVNEWVSGTIASVTTSAPVETTTETPQTTEPAAEVPEANSQTPAQPQTDVASLDSTSTKFTQRLQTDGTESDSGPAPLPTGDATSEAEGKSVAAQTEAGAPVAQAGATGGEAAQTPATGTNPAPAQADVQVPEGAQKMFLYEERLGQSSPTAVEGTVAWSSKEESPGNDAPPEPTIQAQISVPERGLTALMTIKRNTDPSLPASHVVEFVFSLPENFEGGAIESVQRVSMKQNEQARGDALIAVPAKITDDFHMIALNDYPEAVATNTDLLRNRSWIDVPLTYRNGRRALLTLEKGPAGSEAFSKALQAWGRAPANSGQ